MVPDAGEDFKQQRWLTSEALKLRDAQWHIKIIIQVFKSRLGGEWLHLNQEVQLSSSPLIEWRHALTDQRAEILTQLKDLIEAVEHLRGREMIRSGKKMTVLSSKVSEVGRGHTGFRRMKDWASRLLRKWSWASLMLSKSLVELICWSSWENWDSNTSTCTQTTAKDLCDGSKRTVCEVKQHGGQVRHYL